MELVWRPCFSWIYKLWACKISITELRDRFFSRKICKVFQKIFKNISGRLLLELMLRACNLNKWKSRGRSSFMKIQGNIDILMISETKTNTIFPIVSLLLNGFSTPFRLDRDAFGSLIVICFRKQNIMTFSLFSSVFVKRIFFI